MTLKIQAATELAETYWAGHPDANQQAPEKFDGAVVPVAIVSPIDPQ